MLVSGLGLLAVQTDATGNPFERSARWGQARRLEFIDFRLYWDGRINRSDLTRFFSISVPQASIDLARYVEMAPGNVKYDRSEKVYVATAEFRPILVSADAHAYLNELLGITTNLLRRETTFLGWCPPADVVRHPDREVSAATLTTVLKAIRQRLTLEVDYQSLSGPDPSLRQISPHALAFDGFRWHIRSYCHRRREFRDFLFARIRHIQGLTSSGIDPDDDTAWQTILNLKIAPHPNLAQAQRRAVELDYGMQNGVACLRTRHALLFYVLRQLGLSWDLTDDAPAQQIMLANRDELTPYLMPGSRASGA